MLLDAFGCVSGLQPQQRSSAGLSRVPAVISSTDDGKTSVMSKVNSSSSLTVSDLQSFFLCGVRHKELFECLPAFLWMDYILPRSEEQEVMTHQCERCDQPTAAGSTGRGKPTASLHTAPDPLLPISRRSALALNCDGWETRILNSLTGHSQQLMGWIKVMCAGLGKQRRCC